MWVFALILRVILLAVPFDIYFTSPLVRSDVEPRSLPPHERPSPPSSRLVLFVADGLRARSFDETERAPRVKSKAPRVVSRTRIPTESRPGHVALVAGFYEDPSAVAKGWKENPVEFDSVFNRSRATVAWGSPTVVPMFKGDRIRHHCYSHEEEDFSGKVDTRKLDTWVFDRVEELFVRAKTNESLTDFLTQDKIVLFLHLLGLDTSGHTHKPDSRKYQDNIETVDKGIARIEAVIENFYNDNRTSYIFTADHGMTDWGSHGAGSDDETETPFVAWGAGVVTDPGSILPDINQADICPLMASLIGIDIPVDSVGSIPDQFLDATEKDKALHLFSNAKQILHQYNKKRESIERDAISLLFKPFNNLTEKAIWDKVSLIETLIAENKFLQAKIACKEIINLSLTGLSYYQNYYQHSLLNSMTISYIGWTFWLMGILLKRTNTIQNSNMFINKKINKHGFLTNLIYAILVIFVILLCFTQNLPLQYYIYFELPIYLWWQATSYWNIWKYFIQKHIGNNKNSLFTGLKVFSLIILYMSGVLTLLLTFYHRWTLSIAFLGIAAFPLAKFYRQNLPKKVLGTWIFTCMGLAMFSLMPVVGKHDDIHTVGMSGLLWFVLSFMCLYTIALPMLKEKRMQKAITVVPPILMLIAILNKYFVALKFHEEEGLPITNQIISWTLAAMSFIIPLFSSRLMILRLYCINVMLGVFFLLLSVRHECFFLLCLTVNLSTWLIIEHYISRSPKTLKFKDYSFNDPFERFDAKTIITPERALNSDDVRRSFIFLSLIIMSFFGTGNIASLNSFDPQWIRCFLTTFSPFSMATLLISKTLIPFLSVICSFCAINVIVKAPTKDLFLIVLIFSDLMGLIFLHLVTNVGSWLDIGTSISHYVIMETTVFFVSILYCIGHFMTGFSMQSLKIFKGNEKPKVY